MAEIKAKQRDKSIDIAKGIGIILVVYGHMVCPIKEEILLFHMPLFFLLSGYFFSSKDSVKDFLRKKSKALLVPFVLFYILSFLYMVISKILKGESFISYILSFQSFVAPNPPLWFLLSLFEIFVIFFIVEKYIHSEILKLVITCGITLIGYLCAMNALSFLFFTSLSWIYILLLRISDKTVQYFAKQKSLSLCYYWSNTFVWFRYYSKSLS